jgi:hypothetical protein
MQDVGAERVQGRAPPWHTPSPDILPSACLGCHSVMADAPACPARALGQQGPGATGTPCGAAIACIAMWCVLTKKYWRLTVTPVC